MFKKIKKILNRKWDFDFKVTINDHVVVVEQGKQISIPVRLRLSHGNPQSVKLDVNTNWESVGLTAKVLFNALVPDKNQEWKATMMVKASHDTPPGSYLFTIRGSTEGTFRTSEDAVMVNVVPKDKKNKEEQNEADSQDNFQPEQSSGAASPSFSLDNLFAPRTDLNSDKSAPASTGNSAWDRLTAPERKKIEQQTKTGGTIGVIIGLIIVFFAIGSTGVFKELFKHSGGGGSYSGEVRNCIASSFGNSPDCAPNTGGQCLPTIINGKAPACRNGSSCPLIAISGAQYNPYRYCYSVTGNNLCIPCQNGTN